MGIIKVRIKKDMKTVEEFKIKEADKYELGMCKNAAIELLKDDFKNTYGEINTDFKERYGKIVKGLFETNKKLREEILGY